MIDTHCHLTFPEYAGRLREVMASAAGAGVTGAITISTTTADCLDALALAEAHENVWCSAGVHPLYSDRGPHEWANLRRAASHPKCVAWGELGLDNHYGRPPRAVQDAVLEEQLAFIETCMSAADADGSTGHGVPGRREPIDKPVVVHCREAFGDLIPVLKRSKIRPERFVFHCFTGDAADMRMLLDFGAWASFTGVVTYKNAPEVREAALLPPLDRILVETDAPFLTPEPHRKIRTNEPRFCRVTAEFLAAHRGVAWEEFHSIINDNTRRFFGIPCR